MTQPAPSGHTLGAASGVSLFHTDAREYDAGDVISNGIQLITQNADRFAVRLIRPLSNPDGAPILDHRGEQRRAIMAGVFASTDRRHAAELITELNERAADDPRDNLGIATAIGRFNAYMHAQHVGAPITGRLLPGNLGTVRTEGIRNYTTLFTDIDADVGAPPGTALTVAGDLVTVLVEIGVPRRAILVMQSGRGAYVLIAIEPQPLTARPVMQLATRTIARLIEAAGEPVHGDESVFDAPRIMRIPGTLNHKADADPTTPAWILDAWTPGVQAPWSVIEKIAAKSRPKLKLLPAARSKHASPSTERRPLRELFVERGWLFGDRADGVADVRCPNADQHTDGREGAILYPPREPGGPGWLKCSHAHCASLTLFDVYRLLERGV